MSQGGGSSSVLAVDEESLLLDEVAVHLQWMELAREPPESLSFSGDTKDTFQVTSIDLLSPVRLHDFFLLFPYSCRFVNHELKLLSSCSAVVFNSSSLVLTPPAFLSRLQDRWC